MLLGARQVGKTTLLKRLFPNALYLLVDESPIRNALETYSSTVYKQLIGDNTHLIIDEIHLLSDPGRAVKIIYDQIHGVKIAVTGSSALHIKNKATESMAGRAFTFNMHPLTYSEYLVQTDVQAVIDNEILNKIVNLDPSEKTKIYDQDYLLDEILRYGLYPALIGRSDKREYLQNLSNTAVFKDIIELDLIDNRAQAVNLLKALAYQIGNIVNYTELARRLNITTKTVQRYIDIFEQSYILFRLYPFSTKKRDEIGKSPKIYFTDLGMRNALIDNFDGIKLRNDAGALFENFIITEVRKLIDYNDLGWNINYWRQKSGYEVDLVLSRRDALIACEIKLTKGRVTESFTNRYPHAKTHVVTSKIFH